MNRDKLEKVVSDAKQRYDDLTQTRASLTVEYEKRVAVIDAEMSELRGRYGLAVSLLDDAPVSSDKPKRIRKVIADAPTKE